MKQKAENASKVEHIEITNKKVWREWSTNNLYDMYDEKTQGSDEFTLHVRGTMKIKTPPPVEPPVDIQGTLNLILQKLNQHDQYFVEIKKNIEDTNQRIDNLESNVNQQFGEMKVEIKNLNERVDKIDQRIDNLESNVNERFDKIDKRIQTIVELNNLKTGDNHK